MSTVVLEIRCNNIGWGAESNLARVDLIFRGGGGAQTLDETMVC